MDNNSPEDNQVVPVPNQGEQPEDSTTDNAVEDSDKKLPPEEYPTSVVTVEAESDAPPVAKAATPASDESSHAETATIAAHSDELVLAKHRETRAMRRAHEDHEADDVKPGAYAVTSAEDAEEPPIAPSSMSSINTKQRPASYSSDRVSQDAIAKSRGRVTTGAAAASVSHPPPPSVAQRQGSVEPPPAAAARRSSAGSTSSQTTSSLANAKVRGSHRGELRSREMRKSDLSVASSARSSTTQPPADIPTDDDVKPGAQKIPGIGSQPDDYDVESQVPIVPATRTSSLPPATPAAVDYTGLPQVLDAVLVEIDEDGDERNQYQSTQNAPVVQYQYQDRPANCCGCTGCTWATCCTVTCIVFAALIFVLAKDLDTDALIKAINGETDAPTMSPTSSMAPTMSPTFMPSMMPSIANSTGF